MTAGNVNEQTYIKIIPPAPPDPSSLGRPPDPSTSNIKTVVQPQLNYVQPQSSQSNPRTIAGPSHPLVSNLLKQECLVNDWIPAVALVDSGAACCFISRTFVNNHNIEILEGGNYNVTLADKSTTTINEMVFVTLEITHVKFTMSAIVMDALATGDLILGINFLSTFNPNIDWSNLTMSIDTSRYTPATTDGMSPSDIILASFTMVPSMSSNIVPTRLPSKRNVTATSPVQSVQSATPDTRNSLSPSRNTISTPIVTSKKPCNSAIPNLKTTNATESESAPAPTPVIQKISVRQMKQLLKDKSNTILASIVMLGPSTAASSTTTSLSHVHVLSGNNSNYDHSAPNKTSVYNEHEERIHQEYQDLFQSMPKELPPQREHDHRIELIPGSQPPSKPAYRLSLTELDELRKQLDTLLEHGFIRASRSPFGAPMLFDKKKDGSLRMCIDYRALNQVTIKNKYPLPRVDELLNRLAGARYFSKIDLQSGYHQIRMKEEDVHKTAFRTRYGLFEFLVLPFGLTNAPSTFMHMMHDILKPYLDKFCASFLDDIIIFSATLEEHQKHVRLIMDKLRENKLYVKQSKCSFFQTSIEFLGYTVSADGLSMVDDKVKAIIEWPTPTSASDVRSFVGLAGFYRHFIKMFSHTTAPLSNLQKKDTQFRWTKEHQTAFEIIKQHIAKLPTLILPREDIPFVVHTDASAFAVGASLMQDLGRGLQPVAFLSKKLLPAETRYPTHEQELLAIIIALKEWRHYLYGRKFVVHTDHHSLIYFMKQQNMSNRQARWSEFLQDYDFTIEYKPGSTNVVADALSRRPDHQMNKELNTASLNQVSTTVINNENILDQIREAYQHDDECKQILQDHSNNQLSSTEWQVTSVGLIQRRDRIRVPNNEPIRTFIIQSNHDDITAAHRGATKTIDLISRNWYWKNMHYDIKQYVSTCLLCQQNKTTNQSPLGLLQPITTPETRWHTITTDFITGLPRTTAGHDTVILWCDKYSKMIHFAPTVSTIDAPGYANLYINNVVKHHGIPIQVISDRDPRFTSSFWRAVCLQLGTKLKMSTAYHPQTDGQTERNNRTLEEALRNYVNYHQNNWDELLPLLEFSYNNAVNSSTGYSPFFLNYGQHPVTPLTYAVRKEIQVNEAASTMLEQMYTALDHAQENITKAQAAQKKHADKHRRDFEPLNIGDLVLLSTNNLRTPGRSSKLMAQRIGPFAITKVLSKLNYELELPSTLKGIHNRFHIQQLTKYKTTNAYPTRPNIITRPPAEVLPDSKEEVFEVQQVLKHRGTGNRKQYLILWKGYPEHEATWEPASAFKFHQDAIKTYENTIQKQSQKTSTSSSNSSSNANSYMKTRSQSKR